MTPESTPGGQQLTRYETWARTIASWDGICRVCKHDWVHGCHGDCTCLGCNAERQEMEGSYARAADESES